MPSESVDTAAPQKLQSATPPACDDAEQPTTPKPVLPVIPVLNDVLSPDRNFAHVPGGNVWGEGDKPALMLCVPLSYWPYLPHVLKPLNHNVLLLMVRAGHEETDTAALVAILEAQEKRVVFAIEGDPDNGVFVLDDSEANPEPVKIVAIMPRLKNAQEGPQKP